MTKKQAEQMNYWLSTMARLGIDSCDAWALRRIEMTLHRWAEHECNGNIQREGDNGDGKPRWHSGYGNGKGYPIPDREKGALKRLGKIMAQYPALVAFHQGDPRGCALYILRREQIKPGEDISAIYSRGCCANY